MNSEELLAVFSTTVKMPVVSLVLEENGTSKHI